MKEEARSEIQQSVLTNHMMQMWSQTTVPKFSSKLNNWSGCPNYKLNGYID
jgi:hypothetical protein